MPTQKPLFQRIVSEISGKIKSGEMVTSPPPLISLSRDSPAAGLVRNPRGGPHRRDQRCGIGTTPAGAPASDPIQLRYWSPHSCSASSASLS